MKKTFLSGCKKHSETIGSKYWLASPPAVIVSKDQNSTVRFGSRDRYVKSLPEIFYQSSGRKMVDFEPNPNQKSRILWKKTYFRPSYVSFNYDFEPKFFDPKSPILY